MIIYDNNNNLQNKSTSAHKKASAKYNKKHIGLKVFILN